MGYCEGLDRKFVRVKGILVHLQGIRRKKSAVTSHMDCVDISARS